MNRKTKTTTVFVDVNNDAITNNTEPSLIAMLQLLIERYAFCHKYNNVTNASQYRICIKTNGTKIV